MAGRREHTWAPRTECKRSQSYMRRLLIALLVASQAACWSDKVTGSSTVFGTYTLRNVNGSSLPFTLSGSGTNKSEIVADTIWLYEGFTFAESGHYRNTVNGTAT